MDKNEPLGFRMPDGNKIACRTCQNAIKSGICKVACKVYDIKPKAVCFDNAPCPKYEKGEDLLPYEIQI